MVDPRSPSLREWNRGTPVSGSPEGPTAGGRLHRPRRRRLPPVFCWFSPSYRRPSASRRLASDRTHTVSRPSASFLPLRGSLLVVRGHTCWPPAVGRPLPSFRSSFSRLFVSGSDRRAATAVPQQQPTTQRPRTPWFPSPRCSLPPPRARIPRPRARALLAAGVCCWLRSGTGPGN